MCYIQGHSTYQLVASVSRGLLELGPRPLQQDVVHVGAVRGNLCISIYLYNVFIYTYIGNVPVVVFCVCVYVCVCTCVCVRIYIVCLNIHI